MKDKWKEEIEQLRNSFELRHCKWAKKSLDMIEEELEKQSKMIKIIISRILCNLTIFDKEIQDFVKQELDKGEYTSLDEVIMKYFEEEIENE